MTTTATYSLSEGQLFIEFHGKKLPVDTTTGEGARILSEMQAQSPGPAPATVDHEADAVTFEKRAEFADQRAREAELKSDQDRYAARAELFRQLAKEKRNAPQIAPTKLPDKDGFRAEVARLTQTAPVAHGHFAAIVIEESTRMEDGRSITRFLPVLRGTPLTAGRLTFAVYEAWTDDDEQTKAALRAAARKNARACLLRIANEVQ